MMIEMNDKLTNIMNNTDDREKIRLLYELCSYMVGNMDYDELDDDMQTLVEDIANVVNDIDNL